jgi:hypothetical protein
MSEEGNVAIAVELVFFLAAFAVRAAQQSAGETRRPLGAPSVNNRTPRTADGREETILTVNDRVILTVNNENVRLSEFADRLEQLEAVATRIAGGLGVTVEFTRTGPQAAQDAGIPMTDLPLTTDAELE